PRGSRLWASGLGEMREARPGLLPPLPVEVLVGNAFERSGIHAAQIDREPVGVRASPEVGLHPAALPEKMLDDAGVERVALEELLPRHEFEIDVRHDQVQKAGLRTNRAVAALHHHVPWCSEGEPHAPAVTAARVSDLLHESARLPGSSL